MPPLKIKLKNLRTCCTRLHFIKMDRLTCKTLTSRSAEIFQTNPTMAKIPAVIIVVLLFQLAGRLHHPPAKK
jgi:hypothetical protein